MQCFRSLSPCLIKASLLNYWGRLKIAKARVYVPRQPPQPVRTGNWACGQHMWKTHLLLSLLPLMNLLHDTKTFQPLLPSTDSNETCQESVQEESHARWESGRSSRAQWCSFPESNACWHGCWETGHLWGDAPSPQEMPAFSCAKTKCQRACCGRAPALYLREIFMSLCPK